MEMTDEQFSKLPKYAQEYTVDLQRDRDRAVRELNRFLDNQTPSCIYTDDMLLPLDGKCYIQSYRIVFKQGGVKLTVTIFDDHRNIEMQYHQSKSLTGQVALTPVSHQHLRLPAVDS